MEQFEGAISFRPAWDLDPRTVPVPVNQILLRVGLPIANGSPSGETYVTFGHLTAPAVLTDPVSQGVEVLGTVDKNRVPVTVVGHFAFTRERLAEFRDLLSAWLDSNPQIEATAQ